MFMFIFEINRTRRCYIRTQTRIYYSDKVRVVHSSLKADEGSDLAPFLVPIETEGSYFPLLPIFNCSRPIREQLNAA